MANWGAFAGGLTRGYLAGEEMQQTQKRTALMADEVEMRKRDEERRKSEFEWKKQQQELETQLRTEIGAAYKAVPWVTGEDGTIDPTHPDNARHMDRFMADQIRIKASKSMLSPSEQKAYMELQDIAKNKEVAKLAGQFGTTYDLTHLQNDKVKEATGIDFTGASIVQDKQPWGTTNHVLLADGKTRVPVSAILSALGPTGKAIASGLNAEADNARQGYETKARVENMTRDDARRAEEFKTNRERGKVADMLAVKRYIKDGIIQKPEKDPLTGKTTEADPVWNDTAEAMLADRMKKYGTKADDVANAANEADDVQAEIRSALREVDAQAKADIAAAKKAGKKPDEANVRRQYFENFKKNGFKIPEKKKEEPAAAAPAAARGAAIQRQNASGNRVYSRGGSYTVEPGSGF